MVNIVDAKLTRCVKRSTRNSTLTEALLLILKNWKADSEYRWTNWLVISCFWFQSFILPEKLDFICSFILVTGKCKLKSPLHFLRKIENFSFFPLLSNGLINTLLFYFFHLDSGSAFKLFSLSLQVTLIPTHDSEVMREWYQETHEKQQDLNIMVLASSSTVVMQDESFPACKIEL